MKGMVVVAWCAARWRPVRLLVGVLVAGVLAVAGVLPVWAAPVLPLPSSGVGSLTVHKFVMSGDVVDLPRDGTLLPPELTAGLVPLDGVTFTVRQVTGVDLYTVEGWQVAKALLGVFDPRLAVGSVTSFDPDGPGPLGGLGLDGGSSCVTGSGGSPAGVCVFAGLPVGLYLVSETGVPVGVTGSLPFLVTIPLAQADDSWLFDVHIYPKNQARTIAKTVQDDTAVQVGDLVTWVVKADIWGDPVDVNGDGVISGVLEEHNLTGFRVDDALDARLAYVSSAVDVIDDAGTVLASLAAGVDYVFSNTSRSGPAGVSAQYLSIDFMGNNSGLYKLMSHHGKVLRWTITTTVTLVGDGVVPNSAVVFPNESSYDKTPGTPGGPPVTPIVDTRWGGIRVHKISTGTATNVAGAKFVVVTRMVDGDPDMATAVNVGGEVVDGHTVWTSDAQGVVLIAGLRWSWWANGRPIDDVNRNGLADEPGGVQYWLIEVAAPPGFKTLPVHIPFQVTGPPAATQFDYTVENDELPEIPATTPPPTTIPPTIPPGPPFAFTGPTGITAMIILGTGLAAGGIWLLARRRHEGSHA